MSLSDVLSIVAIIVSVISIYKASSVSKEITNKTLRKEYFDKIFSNFMLKDFPQKIMGILELESLEDSEGFYEIDSIIMSIMKECKVYKYMNQDFYLSFYQEIMKLEDKIYEYYDAKEKGFSADEYEKIMLDIEEIAKNIYELLRTEYEC